MPELRFRVEANSFDEFTLDEMIAMEEGRAGARLAKRLGLTLLVRENGEKYSDEEADALIGGLKIKELEKLSELLREATGNKFVEVNLPRPFDTESSEPSDTEGTNP